MQIVADNIDGGLQTILGRMKRYEKHCTIITTNTNFSKWSDIFGNSVIANAILDRLLHHSHIISVKGPSYRTKSKLEHLESSLTKM